MPVYLSRRKDVLFECAAPDSKSKVAKEISNLLAKSANRMVLNTEGLLMNLGVENEGLGKKK